MAEYEIKDGVGIIPEGTTTIVKNAFSRDCKELTSIVIPDSVTNIGYGAFDGCTGLTSIAIGNSVTRVANDAFYDCTGVTEISIGRSLTDLNAIISVFSNLTSIKVAEGNNKYDSRNDCNAIIETKKIHFYMDLLKLLFPNL